MVGPIEGHSMLAGDARESELSNIDGGQPATMHEIYENVGNVPYRSRKSRQASDYSAEMKIIAELRLDRDKMQENFKETMALVLSGCEKMQQSYEKIINELRLDRDKMQQNYKEIIDELRLEKQKYEKDAKERDELMAKWKKEMTKAREEHLREMKQCEDYARRLKSRGLFRRVFNLEPEGEKAYI